MANARAIALQDITISLAPPIVVFALYLAYPYVLPNWDAIDIPLHFLGGLSIAWMSMILWETLRVKKWISSTIPWFLRDWSVWGSVALVGIFWEFYEWLSDHFLGTFFQPSLTDTMGDFFMDLIGGLVFLMLFHVWRQSQGRS